MGPVIHTRGSGYEINFGDENVKVVVKYISARGERFTAQVAVSHQGDAIHRSTLVLNSATGMNSFSKKLDKRRPGEDYNFDWDVIVEDLAGLVIDTYRKGSSEVELAHVETSEATSWRIDNLLIENAPNLIWAEGGSGKSMFALFLAVLLDQGHIDTDHQLVVEPGNVLYLDWETDHSEIAGRVKKIHAGHNISSSTGIIYRYMGQPLERDTDRIRDIVDERNIDVIIYDSMGLAVSGEMENAENVLGFFRAIREIGKTSLVISHSNRQGTIFGSAYTSNAARSVWEASQSGSSGDDDERIINFSLFHRKANNVALQKPQSWQATFMADEISYKRGDVFQTDDKGKLSYADLVYKYVKASESISREELIQEIVNAKHGESSEKVRRNVRTAISNAKGRDHIEETGEILTLKKHDELETQWELST